MRRSRTVGTPVSRGIGTFRGRSQEKDTLKRLLTDDVTRFIMLIGRRGIGKSALATKVVEELVENSSEVFNAIYLSSRTDGLSLEEIFNCAYDLVLDEHDAGRLERIWESKRSERAKISFLIETLGSSRCCVVLDNLDDIQDGDGVIFSRDIELFLDCVFRGTHGLKVLATTQYPVVMRPDVWAQTRTVSLAHGLSSRDAVELLRDLDKDNNVGLRDRSFEELSNVASQVHGIPRALELIVGALNDYLTLPTLDDVVRSFSSREGVLENLLHTSYHKLPDSERIVLQILMVLRRPANLEEVVSCCRHLSPSIDAIASLARLARQCMVSVDRESRSYSLHSLDADLLESELRESDLDRYKRIQAAVADFYKETSLPKESWVRLIDTKTNRAEFDHRIASSDYERAGTIFVEVSSFMVEHGAAAEAVSMFERLEGSLSGSDIWPDVLASASGALLACGSIARSIKLSEAALGIASTINVRQTALRNLGDCYRRIGEFEKAILVLEEAGELARTLRDVERESYVLLSLSLAYSYQGDPSGAHRISDGLAGLAERNGSRSMLAYANDCRSVAYALESRWRDAHRCASRALELYENEEVIEPIGYVANMRAMATFGMGDAYGALVLYRLACDDERIKDHPRSLGICLFNRSFICLRLGFLEEAEECAIGAHSEFLDCGTDVALASELTSFIGEWKKQNWREVERRLTSMVELLSVNPDLVPGIWLERCFIERDARRGSNG